MTHTRQPPRLPKKKKKKKNYGSTVYHFLIAFRSLFIFFIFLDCARTPSAGRVNLILVVCVCVCVCVVGGLFISALFVVGYLFH